MTKNLSSFILIWIFIFLFSGTGFAAGQGSDSGKLDFDLIDSYIENEMAAGKIPGVALGIVKGDSIVYLKGYGSAGPGRAVTPVTPFFIGSTGKTFTALAVRQLINEGKLNESDYIQEYIKEFNPAFERKPENITIKQLLTHTSGLSEADGNKNYLYNSRDTTGQLVNKIHNIALNRPAGKDYEYSNLNYLVLGLLIEKVTGMSYGEYIQKEIFDRLDMKHSYVNEEKAMKNGLAAGHIIFYGMPEAVRYPFPSGAVPVGYQISSAEDMAHYLVGYLNRGYYKNESILPNNPFKLPENPLADSYNGDWYDTYWFENTGYPVSELYLNYYGHEGANPNYTSSMKINQKSRYGIIVLANSRDTARFLKNEVAAWTISKAVMEYAETGKLPPQTAEKGSYERIGWMAIFFSIVIVYAVFSTRELIKLKTGKSGFRGILRNLSVDFIFPASGFFLIPLYYNVSWRWLFTNNPEQNFLVLGVMLLLILAGIMKAGVYTYLRIRVLAKNRP